ncbi:tetratricopeptide repeat protein [Planctomycetota bacterium]
MKGRLIILFTAIILAVTCWFVYDARYRIPAGPELPPALPHSLSNEATEIIKDALLTKRTDREEIMGMLDKAIKIDPRHWEAWAHKGRLLLLEKRYEEALVCYEKLIRSLAPSSPDIRMRYALCLQRLGRGDEAQEQLLFALSAYDYAIDLNTAIIRIGRARVLFLMGRDHIARSELAEMTKYKELFVSANAGATLSEIGELKGEEKWDIIHP